MEAVTEAVRFRYLVMAKDRQTAAFWAKSRQLPSRSWTYASSARICEGLNNVTAVVLPSFFEKRDAKEIMAIVRQAIPFGVTLERSHV